MPHLSANYLTVDPATGAVGANFTGHIHAAGLDLDASPLALPPDVNTVRWLQAVNGALVADIAGLGDVPAGTDILLLRAHSSANDIAQLSLDSSTTDQALFVTAGGFPEMRLLDNFGRSGFFQTGLGHDAQSQCGAFTATFGGALATADFSVTHNFNVGGVQGVAIGRAGGTTAVFCTAEIVGTTVNTATFRTRTIDASVPALNATKVMNYLLWTP